MKTAEEPTSSLGQTLEWLRKELVSLYISFYLVLSHNIFQGSLVPHSQVPPRLGQSFRLGYRPCRHPSGTSHTVHNHHLRCWDK